MQTRSKSAKGGGETSSSKCATVEERNIAFRFLDLPENIRVRIYSFVLGFRVIYVDTNPQSAGNGETNSEFKLSICDSSLVLDTYPSYDEVDVDKMLYKCTVPIISCYHCIPLDDEATHESLSVELLRVCKQIYTESKNALFTNNLFTITTWNGFTNFLLEPSGGPLRATAITKLAFLVDPKTPQMHFLNETLGELYLPDGTMSSPEPHFPALNTVHLVIGSGGCERPKFTEWEKWRSFLWIWAFSYFAIEELRDVSVAMSDNYVVRNSDWDRESDGNGLGEGMRWIKPSGKDLKDYEYEVRLTLLREWMGGDQDDVELRHSSYDMRTRDIDFWDWEP